ncbi:MAG: hypothetical protein WAU52_02845 [Burkholderiales bacterium]
MSRVSYRSQRGIALIALLAVFALGATWYMVHRLNADSGRMTAVVRDRNADVLNRAKQALIGYVANDAADSAENNPGRLPCPEAPGYFDNPSTEGTAAGTCTLPAVGRFPWRTLGLDKLVDASGEPLWYVVSPGWAYSGSNLTINSNTPGQLTVDGVANDSVALIIAPGPAFGVQAAGGCAAKSQVRPTSGTPDPANYLECQNAVGTTFVTTGPTGSFNDQVLRVTAADVLPGIEAAIADRIERQIAPALRSMYSGGPWSGSSSSPALPFAAPFGDPTLSAMQGVSGTFQGLLPMVYSETTPGSGVACAASPTAPRCNPTFNLWSNPSMSGGSTYSESCSISGGQINCTYYYRCSLFGCAAGSTPFSVTVDASNVGMSMRKLIPQATLDALAMANVSAGGRSISGTLGASGTATITLSGAVNYSGSGLLFGNSSCGLIWPLTLILGCKQSTLSIPLPLLQDHALLDSTDPTYGWFVRNKWYEVAYYAVAPGFSPSGAKSCTNNGTCLTVNYHSDSTGTPDAGKQRAIVILSGRTLTGTTRPNGTLSDWLEGANADGTSPFEVRSATLLVNRSFNDRVAVLDSN